MNNLDLIRAKNALEACHSIDGGANDGEVVKKVPSYIINNGLLAAAAFANENARKKEKSGYEDVFKAIVKHLVSIKRIDSIPESSEGLIKYLVSQDSAKLRDVTAETMAYLNYLRRFASKKKED